MKPVELRAHQKEAVLKLASGKILVGDVGSGKTLTAVAYYVAAQAPRDVYVITTAKKRDSLDWEDEFIKFGVWKDEDTFHGRLTVDSWNNIGKYTEVKDAFFIFDEQRLVGSGQWTKSFYKIAKRNGWILLSATPGDTWLDYIPVMVANGFYKNKTDFIRRHVVFSPFVKYPKVQRYLEPGTLVRRRNQIQVIMPFERHTTRRIHTIITDYDEVAMRKVYVEKWNIYKEEPLKDIADLFRVARRLVNTDPSRLSTVRTLLQKHPRLIVFYNFDYELEQLRSLGHCVPSASEHIPQTLTTASAVHGTSSNGDIQDTTGSSRLESTDSSLSRTTSLASQPQRSTSTSTECDECNPEHGGPCDPIVHGTERQWTPQSQSTSRLNPEIFESGSTDMSTSSSIETQRLGSSGSTFKSESRAESSSSMESSRPSMVSHSPAPVRNGEDEWRSTTQDSSSSSGTSTAEERSEPGTPERDLSGLVVAEWNGHKHEPVPTGERWVYLVQYTAGAEGWNCITTDAMVFYSLPYSYKIWHQAHGRIDRMNTPFFDLHYYVLQSKSWIDDAIRRSLRGKKSFNEASWGRKAA